ncbi:hypothetical protein WJX64_04735 [Leifsonia sp. YIM 134122]|uniref:DUF4397 domain-containing protein n=1 Tax=Leifsonia stereocauli TaxID=3134136 RepID=A0ABU9W1H5_9MICO
MYSNRGIYRALAIASSLGIGAAISLVGASPASADELVQIVLDPVETAVEYGEFWNFTANMSVVNATSTGVFFEVGAVEAQVSVSGQEDPYDTALIYPVTEDTSHNSATSYAHPSDERPPLDVGDYDVTMSVDIPRYGQRAAGSSEPARLSITPAVLNTEVRAVPDPSNPENVVITGSLAGDFVSKLNGWDAGVNIATLPAGTWHLTMTAADGTVVLDRSIDQEPGIQPSVSTYWTDAVAGVEYTADAVFTPTAASAGNFEIAAPTAFPFTASESQRPIPTSTAAAAPVDSGVPSSGLTLPLWSLIGAGLVGLGLLIALIVLAARLRTRRRPSVSIAAKETLDVV